VLATSPGTLVIDKASRFKVVRLPALAELNAVVVPGNPAYIPAGFTGRAAASTLGKALFGNVPFRSMTRTARSVDAGVEASIRPRTNYPLSDSDRSRPVSAWLVSNSAFHYHLHVRYQRDRRGRRVRIRVPVL
jgi:hypothetical protein